MAIGPFHLKKIGRQTAAQIGLWNSLSGYIFGLKT
jgi:hypothetical protein